MKEKKTTIPPAGAAKNAAYKRLLMMAMPIIVAVLLLFVPVPEGLPLRLALLCHFRRRDRRSDLRTTARRGDWYYRRRGHRPVQPVATL